MRMCLDCRELASPRSRNGSRCTACERKRNAIRNADPKRRAYRDPAYRAIPLVGACVDCGATTDLTRDHVVPLAAGGTNAPSNVVIRCRRHNSSKGARKTSET